MSLLRSSGFWVDLLFERKCVNTFFGFSSAVHTVTLFFFRTLAFRIQGWSLAESLSQMDGFFFFFRVGFGSRDTRHKQMVFVDF